MGELLTSGKMAELNCVSKKTLRLYREMGLLKPVQVDEVTGYCFYSYDQCSTIDMIQQLQTLGISLAEIKELLEGDDSADIVELLEEHRRAIDQEMLPPLHEASAVRHGHPRTHARAAVAHVRHLQPQGARA